MIRGPYPSRLNLSARFHCDCWQIEIGLGLITCLVSPHPLGSTLGLRLVIRSPGVYLPAFRSGLEDAAARSITSLGPQKIILCTCIIFVATVLALFVLDITVSF